MESLLRSPVHLGVALGAVWSSIVLLLGLAASFLRRGTAWVETVGRVYLGYRATLWGSLIGGIWGFADGFISGLLIGWFYRVLRF